jgi:uncharacterized protein
MPPRLLTPDVTTALLDHEDLPADEVLRGSPTAAVHVLDALPGCEVGLWEMTRGTARDTEVDEVFVVVSGRGSVTFQDGEALDLGPGVAVRLRAGERTEWTVTETLRKIWVA